MLAFLDFALPDFALPSFGLRLFLRAALRRVVAAVVSLPAPDARCLLSSPPADSVAAVVAVSVGMTGLMSVELLLLTVQQRINQAVVRDVVVAAAPRNAVQMSQSMGTGSCNIVALE